MENDLSEWGRYLRVCISGLLFIGLVIGGGAAALAALGAGLNALAGGQVAVQQQVASVPSASTSAVTATAPAQSPGKAAVTKRSSTSTPATKQTQPVGGGIYSPVGDAIDTGGVVIGNHVQSAFGNALSHVLNILFMEQDTAQGSGSNQP